MLDAIWHRGPDAGGEWIDAPAGIALGHRRLAIIDLSEAGAQPMSSACGRYVISFNGEIYNYRDLRAELDASAAGRPWRGHSDTEVVLEYIAAWGVEAALRKCVGMFAFALWDRRDRVLCLARDRFGEKPLYYGMVGGSFVFASELKAFAKFPGFVRDINRDALALFMRHNCVPAPFSIYRGIHKLLPATWLVVDDESVRLRRMRAARKYWSLRETVERGHCEPFRGTDGEAAEELERLLRVSIAGQMAADVPLGAFLSGGIDSSTIVAIMQAQSSRPVRTFSIGFHEENYNEAPYAKAIAEHLQTEHTEFYVTPQEALDVIPKLPSIYDEPFSDSSQIPTYLVASLARKHVTVALSGDAGDELFAGYNHYALAAALWRSYSWMPRTPRACVARLLAAIPTGAWDALMAPLWRILPDGRGRGKHGEKVHRAAELLRTAAPLELYQSLCSHWKRPSDVVIGGTEPETLAAAVGAPPVLREFVSQMMYMDALGYLPDDILVKVDRAAMAVSLETRVPLLDHRVVEFAWRLPLTMKVRERTRKWIFRQVLYRYVPRELVERRKMGFGVPLGAWLRGPLKEWASDLLDSNRLKTEGFLRPEPIRALWQQHIAGRDFSYYLWDVLMFQAWLQATR